MRITSTQFQQKVGYYLDLAEQGETIEIERLKPNKGLYELKPKKISIVNDKGISKKDKLLKKLKKYGTLTNYQGSSVDAVKKIRD